jgi:hypothetical protein
VLGGESKVRGRIVRRRLHHLHIGSGSTRGHWSGGTHRMDHWPTGGLDRGEYILNGVAVPEHLHHIARMRDRNLLTAFKFLVGLLLRGI